MSDLIITAANVLPASSAQTEIVTAGATITAGQPVYKDASDDDKAKLAVASSAAAANAVGIALCNASAGQPLVIAYGGDVTLGSVMSEGVTYLVSSSAGGIMPTADIAIGDFATVLGTAVTTSSLRLKINASGGEFG